MGALKEFVVVQVFDPQMNPDLHGRSCNYQELHNKRPLAVIPA